MVHCESISLKFRLKDGIELNGKGSEGKVETQKRKGIEGQICDKKRFEKGWEKKIGARYEWKRSGLDGEKSRFGKEA